MIKLKVSYKDAEEKDKLIRELKNLFKVVNVSKEYDKKGEYKRIYVDLK